MVHTWKRVGRPISISFKMFELKNIYLFVWRYIYMYMKWLLLFLKLVKKKNFNGIEIPWCMFLTDVYNFYHTALCLTRETDSNENRHGQQIYLRVGG